VQIFAATVVTDNMKKTSRLVALSALFVAFSVIFLYLAAVLPTGQLGFIAVASLFGIAAVVETGIKGGIFVFVGSAILGFIIIPDKSSSIFYALFFGYYPILKSIAEQIKSRFIEWILKVLIFNIALTVIVLLFSQIMFSYISFSKNLFVIYLLANACFIIFDIGVSKAIGFYINKISKRIK